MPPDPALEAAIQASEAEAKAISERIAHFPRK
jgi:hypothetical protein